MHSSEVCLAYAPNAVGYEVPGLRSGQQLDSLIFRCDRARDFPALLGELPILFHGLVLLEPKAHQHDDARMAILFLPES
jgi:hypothetical protein